LRPPRPRGAIGAQHVYDLLEHGRREEEVDEIGIELRRSPFHQLLSRFVGAAGRAIAPTERDGVECIGDGHDAGGDRDGRSP
jgi:hypothetical protein